MTKPTEHHGALQAVFTWGMTAVGYVLEHSGIHSWGDFAAILASIYSLMLIVDWVRRKIKSKIETVKVE